jgi:5'-3' exonuclease
MFAGVPAFYKWLVDKYPHIVDSVVEDKWLDELGNAQAVDATQPNPNGIESALPCSSDRP